MPQGQTHAPGNNAALGALLAGNETRKMSPDDAEDEGVLMQQTRWAAGADPHEPPGPGASGGSAGTDGSLRTVTISTRAAERLTS